MTFRNTSTWDRGIRIAVGLIMLVLGWQANAEGWSLSLRVFALYPLITGLAGWCPIYALLRFSSKQRRDA